MKAILPFTAASQYAELHVVFAPGDYSNAVISAKVKLVGGGDTGSATCPAHAVVYAIDNGDFIEPTTAETPVTLLKGQWTDAKLTVPATGYTHLDEIGIRFTTYPCAN